MRILDTQVCNQTAALVQSWQQSVPLPDQEFQQIHEQIQTLISKLARFFRQLAAKAEETENSLLGKMPYTYVPHTGWKASGGISGSAAGLAAGGKLKASGKAEYALAGCFSAVSTKNSHASAGLNVGAFEAEAEASFRLCRKKKISPELAVTATASAALLSAKAEASTGNKWIGLSGALQGEAGAAYAEAKAVLTQDEQTLGFNVGAAAVRGRCEFAIDLKFIKITVGISLSAMSAEAGMEYSHKKRQAMFSAKLGFIAGGGCDIKIDY